jgi:hypothetical protein
MAYRGDSDPLKTQETALASELSSLRRRERDVARALDATRAELRGRTLPLLDDVRIASPCSASWDEMTGDARVRFCGKCAKNVYNLSEMTRDEAEALLAQSERAEARMCVRLYKRRDGTVLTADCPVGVKRKNIRRVVAVAAGTLGAGALASVAASFTMMGARAPTERMGEATMGDWAGGAVSTGETAKPDPPARPESPHPPAPAPQAGRGSHPAHAK